MKTGKKLISLLLVLVLAVCLSAGALATETPGTLIINNPMGKQTYTIYKLFDLTYTEETNSDGSKTTIVSYTYNTKSGESDNPWNGFFIGDNAPGAKYVTITFPAGSTEGNVAWRTTELTTSAPVFAKEALAYAKANGIAGIPKYCETDTNYLSFENLEYGYYLVDSTYGSLCMLTSVDPEATVNEKNQRPYVLKQVKEGDNWQSWNDANVGDTVYFQTTITVKDGMENYVLHDIMEDGFTFSNSVTVKLLHADTNDDGSLKNVGTDGTTVYSYTGTPEVVDSSNYTLTTGQNGDTFTVSFTNEWISTLLVEDHIIVEYTAILNENAKVGGASDVETTPSNVNRTWLTYGDNGESLPSKTDTYTWRLTILKTKTGNTPLNGAKFTLSKNPDGSEPIAFSKVVPTPEGSYDTYYVASSGVTELVTENLGAFNLFGLDSGTYYLTETEAPVGYNILTSPIEIIISSQDKTTSNIMERISYKYYNDATYLGQDLANTTVNVENKAGETLPTTGGIGTTIFYIVGAVLVVGAAVILVVRRRMSVEK